MRVNLFCALKSILSTCDFRKWDLLHLCFQSELGVSNVRSTSFKSILFTPELKNEAWFGDRFMLSVLKP